MHRDQIRIFPGDVESQVRRLMRFRAQAPEMMVIANDVGENLLASRYLDYEPRELRPWERWRRELWEQRVFIALVIVYLLCWS